MVFTPMTPLHRALGLALLSRLAAAQSTSGSPQRMSPIVTWDPSADRRPPTQRALTMAELKTTRARADRFYDLLKATPSFSKPTTYVTLATACRATTAMWWCRCFGSWTGWPCAP